MSLLSCSNTPRKSSCEKNSNPCCGRERLSSISNTGLNKAIAKLRGALNHNGSSLVETLPRRGYRFTADVQWTCEESGSPRLHEIAAAGTPLILLTKNGAPVTHYERADRANIVLIAPDLLDTFPDSESVNEALRGLKKIAARSAKPMHRLGEIASAV